MDSLSECVQKPVSKRIYKCCLKKLKYSYRRIRRRVKKKPDHTEYNKKVFQLLNLLRLEKEGFIELFYGDGAGVNQTPSVPYGWQPKGNPLSIPSETGKRLNLFGFMSRWNKLFIRKTDKPVNSKFVMDTIDEFALSDQRAPRSIIILDNAPVHHSKIFKERIPFWQEQGLEIFFLPTYSPHLNLIETLWRKIKYEWILPADYFSWENLTSKIDLIINQFGSKYTINFSAL